MKHLDPYPALPVCDRCGLLIYPPGTAGQVLQNGCTCSHPKPQPGLLPAGEDAVQLALFPKLPPEHKTRAY